MMTILPPWNKEQPQQASGPLPSYYPPPGLLYGTNPELLNIAMRRYWLEQKRAQAGIGGGGNPVAGNATAISYAPANVSPGRLGSGASSGLGAQAQQETRLDAGFLPSPARGQNVVAGLGMFGQNTSGQVGGRGLGDPAQQISAGQATYSDPMAPIRQTAAVQSLKGLYGFGGMTDPELNRLVARYNFGPSGMDGQSAQTGNTMGSSAQSAPRPPASNRQPTAGSNPPQNRTVGQQNPPQAAPQVKWAKDKWSYDRLHSHGWDFVTPRDRTILDDMVRRGDIAGANAYAQRVADQVLGDHPVEMSLPYGPPWPGDRQKLNDIDKLEHSPDWEQVSPQERAALATYLATGRVQAANQYARTLQHEAHGREGVVDKLRSHLTVATPPASSFVQPGAPPQAYDDARINSLRLWQVKNILDNENAGMKRGQASEDEWRAANLATAEATMNGDIAFGSKRPGTATSEASKLPPDSQQSNYDWDITRQAYLDRKMNRPDVAAGTPYFGTSDSRPIHGRPADLEAYKKAHAGDKVLWQDLQRSYGPFQYPGHSKYVDLYGTPYWVKKGQKGQKK